MSEFHRLIEQQIPRLRRFARVLTRDSERADDLVQETLARAIAKAHLWQTGTDMRAWLFTIMHNQNVNAVRRAIREVATVNVNNCSNLIAATDPTASRQLHELGCALAQISEEQRQVILLVGLEGMRYEEAAAVLDVPVGTIRSRLSRGRDALRQLMDMDTKRAGTSAVRKSAPEDNVRHPLWPLSGRGLSAEPCCRPGSRGRKAALPCAGGACRRVRRRA
jgi:RNA polymerase sigma-70 factor (ECF subfamily)